MAVQIGKEAPDFVAAAVVDGQIKTGFKLSDHRGKYVVLFFYPLDFTFVCPTELIAFDTKLEEFTKRNAAVIACSIDSQFSHKAWNDMPRSEGGLGGVKYPIVADLTKSISTDYGVLADAGYALRGLFLIDQKGIVQHLLINNAPLGRSVDEAIRMLDSLQHFEKFGEVCPANWKPGSPAIKPADAKAYFKKVNS